MKYFVLLIPFIWSCTSNPKHSKKDLNHIYDEVSSELCNCILQHKTNLIDDSEDSCEYVAQSLFAETLKSNHIDPFSEKAQEIFNSEIIANRLYTNCKAYIDQIDTFMMSKPRK